MNLYGYKVDNSIWGCGDIECCGGDYEKIEWDFIISDEPMTAEEYKKEFGSGDVLEIRPATDSEVDAYFSGQDKGYAEANEAFQKKLKFGNQENL